MSAFHRRIIRRVEELRAEGEDARASRLEKALAHVEAHRKHSQVLRRWREAHNQASNSF